MTFDVPHCRHGNIILGCPLEDCPEQTAYLAEHSAAIDRYIKSVRILLGLPL